VKPEKEIKSRNIPVKKGNDMCINLYMGKYIIRRGIN